MAMFIATGSHVDLNLIVATEALLDASLSRDAARLDNKFCLLSHMSETMDSIPHFAIVNASRGECLSG